MELSEAAKKPKYGFRAPDGETDLLRGLKRLFDFLASYGLSCVLFLILLALTYLGTMYQVENGLYAAQEKYFGSLFLIHWVGGAFPVPLPGGYLVMAVLFANLLCGGIVRARKGWSKLGILLAHLGMCVLLIGAFITYRMAETGYLLLYEGDKTADFESYHDWEIAIAEGTAGTVTEYLIPQSDFVDLTGSRSRTFQVQALPFDLVLTGYVRNAALVPTTKGSGKAVDGKILQSLPLSKENDQNIPGAYIAIQEKSGGKAQEHILAGQARPPLVVTAGEKPWKIELRKKRHPLPFTIALNKFSRELYPGTSIPRVFKSDVTRTDAGITQDCEITMNEPMRHRGYTLFQSSWGPAEAQPGDHLYSVLAVVRNPADRFPLYACLVVTVGLTIHFSIKLLSYLKSTNRKSA